MQGMASGVLLVAVFAVFGATGILSAWSAVLAATVAGGVLSGGDRIEGDLARPDGAGSFPAVVVLHGCAGMHDATKQKLVAIRAGALERR